MCIREVQKVQDRERVLRHRFEETKDTIQYYPGPETMGAMILLAVIALCIALLFQVVSVAVIYCPVVIVDSITIIVLRQISDLEAGSYWRRFCLLWCCINAHILLTVSVVPVVDLGFSVAYRFAESENMHSDKMRANEFHFRHYLSGDVCILILACGCTIYAMLTCVLCYATREQIYTSYPVIDLRSLDT